MTFTTTIRATSRQRLSYELQPDAEALALARYRTEYVSFGLAAGLGTADTEDYDASGTPPTVRKNLVLLVGSAEIFTWKWPFFYWTAFELRGGGGFDDGGVVFAGTRVGLRGSDWS